MKLPARWAILSAILVVCANSLAEDETQEQKPEPERGVPKILITSPHVRPGEKYAHNYRITIGGRISRDLGWKQNIDFKVYQVLEGGWLYRQTGGGVMTDDKGHFWVTFDPPKGGWKPGQLRIYGRVNSFSAITGIAEIPIADGEPVDDVFYIEQEPTDSGVVIDTDQPPADRITIPSAAHFKIRGTFQPERFQGAKIEIITCKMYRLKKGQVVPIIVGTGGTRVFAEENGERWFELEMEAPRKPGKHRLVIDTLGETPDGNKIEPWVYDLFVVDDEPEKENDAPQSTPPRNPQ